MRDKTKSSNPNTEGGEERSLDDKVVIDRANFIDSLRWTERPVHLYKWCNVFCRMSVGRPSHVRRTSGGCVHRPSSVVCRPSSVRRLLPPTPEQGGPGLNRCMPGGARVQDDAAGGGVGV